MSCPSSSPQFLSNKFRLRFFSRIRRFLYPKTKRCGPSVTIDKTEEEEIRESSCSGSSSSSSVREDCYYGIVMLQRSVKKLHFGRSWEEKEEAIEEIRKLAGEGGGCVKVRKSLAELGVIPALVSMVDAEAVGRRRLAVTALIELANGTFTNKALIVEAGILSKLPENIDAIHELMKLEFARLLLSLSSLVNAHFPLVSSTTVMFLMGILESCTTSIETKELCIGTLYNLSTTLDNVVILVTNKAVHTLLRMALTNEVTEKSLVVLGNLVVTLVGKKAMESDEMVPDNLIEIMTWEERPKCQELCAYILMVLAHQSSAQRKKMAKAGIVPVLLEVALLGSPLAQKRALKLLKWFKDEGQTRMEPHSGPQTGRVVIGSPLNKRDIQKGRRMMKSLVRQSLNKNMEVITRRAKGGDEDSSEVKALIVSSSSKSLPY